MTLLYSFLFFSRKQRRLVSSLAAGQLVIIVTLPLNNFIRKKFVFYIIIYVKTIAEMIGKR